MKTLLAGINAKYTHSNPAIRGIQKYAALRGESGISFLEFTINQRIELVLSELYRQKPDILGFSCYIWNYGMICDLIPALKKLLPETIIFLGGPEVSFDPEVALRTSGAHIVVIGEGEQTCLHLIQAIKRRQPLSQVNGIAFLEQGTVTRTSPAAPLPMDDIPFLYDDGLTDLEHRILYFESMRGCPFQCQYCLSGNENGVRFMSLPKVYEALDFFLKHRVRQVKFVDRTFNCSKSYAMSIWKYLHEHDNGCTNFHFEIAAELLDDETIAYLNTMRPGIFQLEIGVQSTNHTTLEIIRRRTDIKKLRHTVKGLQQGNNIHLHLDLIAGLPAEGYRSFRDSFNDVYALSPDQLQLGFLKLLKGSGLRRDSEKYGLVYHDAPPYEILYTKDLSYDELLKLKRIEEMVELYYNSNRFRRSLVYLLTLFDAPFDFYASLAEFYERQGYHLCSHSVIGYYTILKDFFRAAGRGDIAAFQSCVRFDLYAHEKVRKLPDWLEDGDRQYQSAIFHFYENEENIRRLLPEYKGIEVKRIYRQAHIEVLPVNPWDYRANPTAVLFNYRRRGLLGNAEYTLLPQLFSQTERSRQPE